MLLSRPMIQAAVTMQQLQQQLDNIGHNLANSETTGYKNRQSEFSSLLFQQIDNLNDPANLEGRLTPDGLRVGSGARLGATNIDLTEGAIKETKRDLDVALLHDNHLFQVAATDGEVTETHYTRDGSFYLQPVNNNAVMLTTEDGDPVLGDSGPIVIQEGFDDIDIQPDGQIVVTRNGQTEIAGVLEIVEAIRPRLLETTGQNNFRLVDLEALGYNTTDVIQMPAEQGNLLKSGELEHSNVDMAKEMTDMITAQRSYQFNARTISMGDQMMELINQLR